MSAVCPSHEVDELTISLLNIFETRGMSFVLLEALIKQEVQDTENESELLRRTCVATKMLSIYAKWKGSGYLRSTLQKVVERLITAAKDVSLELDPTRVGSPEELENNATQLQVVAKVFIEDIRSSVPSMPPSFRKICSLVSTPWAAESLQALNMHRSRMRLCLGFRKPSTRLLVPSSSCVSSALLLSHPR